MSRQRPADIRLRDPLSAITRAERRTLLGASAIGIVIAKTGLVPSKISTLGIEFTQTDQRSLLLAIAAIILYFSIAFVIYAGSDFLAWRIDYQEVLKAIIADEKQSSESGDQKQTSQEEIKKRSIFRVAWLNLTRPMSFLRALFEFILPLMIGLYAIVALLRAPV